MDPVSMGFYGCICGILGVVLPQLKGRLARFGVGAVVGVVSAGLYPVLRGLIF